MNSEYKYIEFSWSPHIWLGIGFQNYTYINNELWYEIAICIPFCLISIIFRRKL